VASSGCLRNNTARTREANTDPSSLEKADSNQRKTEESTQSSCGIPPHRMCWILQHDMNSKSKGGKNVQETFTVAIKYKDITYGLGSAGSWEN